MPLWQASPPNDPVEAVYLVNLTDDLGESLIGAHKYEVTFPKGLAPPVDAYGR